MKTRAIVTVAKMKVAKWMLETRARAVPEVGSCCFRQATACLARLASSSDVVDSVVLDVPP